MSRLLRVGTLSSGRGRGTNLRSILNACGEGRIPATVGVVVSTTIGAPALQIAASAGVPACYFDPEDGAELLDRLLAGVFQENGVELVCLTGYMRLLGPSFLAQFPMRIMNVHPALLPAFGGKGFYGRRVHEAVIESGARFTGATVHFVDPEYDHGPIILQSVVPVLDDDTADTLAARVLVEEHRLYPEAISLFAQGRLQVRGRRVQIVPTS